MDRAVGRATKPLQVMLTASLSLEKLKPMHNNPSWIQLQLLTDNTLNNT